MLGEKRRPGAARSQYEAMTLYQILLIGEIFEEDWSKSIYGEEKKELESTIAFATITFCVSLQGKEFSLTVIEGLKMFWKETRNHCRPHMMMTLKVRFKGEKNLRRRCVPLADQTKSAIPTRRWTSRILYRQFELENQERVLLFDRENVRKASIGDYDNMLRNLLEQGQKMHPELFTT